MKSLDNSTCLLHFVTRVIFIKPVFIWIMHIYPTRIKTETAVIKSQLQWHWCFFKYIKKTLHVVTCSCCTRWSDHTLGLPKSINIKLNCVNKETEDRYNSLSFQMYIMWTLEISRVWKTSKSYDHSVINPELITFTHQLETLEKLILQTLFKSIIFSFKGE